MDYNFGDRIKALRRGRDMTQEKLADVLGVTYQAVSRWETNGALPDVALIPILARFFGVTTDELFGMDALRDKEHIAEKRRPYIDAALDGDDAAALALIRDLAREYPNNDALQLEYVALLMYAPDDKTRHNAEAVPILERLAESHDADTRNFAVTQLPRAHANSGNRPRAFELAKRLPSAAQGREGALTFLMNEPDYVLTDDDIAMLKRSVTRFAQMIISAVGLLGGQNKGVRPDEMPSGYLDILASAMGMSQFESQSDFADSPVRSSVRTLLELAADVADRSVKDAILLLEQAAVAFQTAASAVGNAAQEFGAPDAETERYIERLLTADDEILKLFDRAAFDPIRHHARFKAVVAAVSGGAG
ncbi:MAG: helix-turn-helix domain-containing protein [Oscillospiraceae bacterium]|jgi:transcriptional regulator with XRE-family HTH domain|nr:helix-turn-helix domain-containing protein [Oscillospiraceae bacterium]